MIARKLDELPENCSQRQKQLKIGNSLLSHRILSAQKAVFCITDLHVRGSSRSYVFINTNRSEKRGRLVKSIQQLRAMSTGDDVFNAGPLERYQARPDGETFHNMSLVHFSVWYNVVYKNYEPTSSRAQPRYDLK